MLKYLNAVCFENGFFTVKNLLFNYPGLQSGTANAGYKDRNNKPITKWFMKYMITFDDRRAIRCTIILN